METYTQQWNKEGYIKFTKGYSDFIGLDLGAWTSLKSSELGLTYDIIHNLPLQSFNYQYKFHEDLSPVVLLLKPQLIKQAVDIVFDSIRIWNDYPEELVKAVMQDRKNIYAVLPKKKATSTDHLKFCMEMQNYKEKVIKRLVYKRAMEKFGKIFEILNTKQ